MRPLFATDSTEQLRIACAQLARFANASRSRRAASAPAPAPLEPELKAAIWRIRIRALLRRVLMGIGVVIFLVCAAWLLKIAPRGWYDPHQHELELQAYRQWSIDHPVYDSDKVIGRQYEVTLPDGRKVMARWMGQWLPALPPNEVHLGDEYFYGGGDWVWWMAVGGSTPQWIDP